MKKKIKTEDRAEAAGEKYAYDQINGEYFMNWVQDQLVEASKMPADKVLPLKTKADATKIAKKMLEQLEWDAKRDMHTHEIARLIGDENGDVADFWEGFHRACEASRDRLADEILAQSKGMRGGVEEEVPKGTKAIATRITNAEERFIEFACETAGLTRTEAERALAVYRKERVIKIDPVTGQFTFKHGDFAEPDVLRRAANTPINTKRTRPRP